MWTTGDEILCGIDPGRSKFGLALVRSGADELLFSAVPPVGETALAFDCLVTGSYTRLAPWRTEGTPPENLPARHVYIGGGTGHALFVKLLDEKRLSYTIIDESHTSLSARALYWRLHPPRGIMRLLPLSTRVPPRPIDDLAAWAIAVKGATEM